MKKIKQLLNSSLIIYFERFLCALSGLILSTLIVRFVNENAYGEIKSFLAYSEILKVIFSLGLGGMLIRFLPIITNAKKSQLIVKQSIFSSLFFSLVFSIFLVFYLGFSVELLLLSILYMAKSVWFESPLISYNKRTVVALTRSLGYVGQAGMISILVYFDQEEHIKLIYVALMLLEFLLLYYFYHKLIVTGVALESISEIPENRKLVKYAGGVYISSLIMLVSSSSVKVALISEYSTAEMVAIFALAAVFPNLLRSFSPSKILLGYLFPKIIRRTRDLDCNDFTKSRLALIYLYNNFFLILFSCLLIAFSPVIYDILYAKELDSEFVYLIAILCCSNITLQFVDLHEVITSIKAQSELFVVISVVAVISLLTYPLAITHFGVLGLVIASFISSNIILVTYFILLKKSAMIKICLLNQSKAQGSIFLFTVLISNQQYYISFISFVAIIIIAMPFKLFNIKMVKNVFR